MLTFAPRWELTSRYYLDTRFELAVDTDSDGDGEPMKLIDGGMHGTTDATWAGNIQRAEWPARNNRSTSSGLESHYFDFHVEVPPAGGEGVYLGYVSYDNYELRVFNDKYEIWLRGGGSALGTYPAATAGRRNIGIRAGHGASVWVDGVEIFGGGPGLAADTVAGFGSKAVHHGGGTYSPGLTLFENLNYQRAYYRTIEEDEQRIQSGGRVVVRTFDGPVDVVQREIPMDTTPYIILYQRQDGDSTQITRNIGGNEESLILLPNGRRAAAHVIAAGMDVMAADPETGELQEYGEGSLPGNLMTLVQDAGGHVVNFCHGHVGPWTGPDNRQEDGAT